MLISKSSVLVVAAILFCPEASAFLSVNQRQQFFFLQGQRLTDKANYYELITSLSAKAGTKKKAKKTGGATGRASGGFGKVTERKTSKKSNADDDDYSAYPALQEEVKKTLIPSDVSFSEISQDLPKELYDRLNQIYGFENFNYPWGWFDEDDNGGNVVKEEGSISFDELLSSDSSKTSPSSSTSIELSDLIKATSSGTSNSDFSDIIASATGGDSSQYNDNDNKEVARLNISNLEQFSKFRVLHVDPMVLAVDDFFSPEECDAYVDLCKAPKKRTSNNDMPMMSRSKTVGKDSVAKAQRTSTTWYHHFKSVPELVAKATRLFGLDTIIRWEEPQTVRYQQSEKFTWHLDALAPSDSLNENGGQRVATLLVYLTDIGDTNGGSTIFRDLGGEDNEYLKVKPKKGSALIFFPAAGGIPNTPFDVRTLHAGEALSADATEDKWIAQMWLREKSTYKTSAPPGNSHADATDAINEFCSN